LLGAAGLAGCASRGEGEPGGAFYDQVIQPIFDARCIGNTSPCHRVGPDGTALGNLDLTSFQGLAKRRDVLFPFGSYPVGQLLLKGGVPIQLPFRGGTITTEISHAGGMSTLPMDGEAYQTLKKWIQNGATIDNTPGAPPKGMGISACSPKIRSDYDPSKADPRLVAAAAPVQTIFQNRCAYGNCHGATDADFYLTCGLDDQQKAYNAMAAQTYIGKTLSDSEVLSRPLGPGAGISHTGGAIFQQGAGDPDFKTMKQFVMDVIALGGRTDPMLPAPQKFFEDQVLPRLIARGCAFQNCHGIGNFNDLKLRPGGAGAFSRKALDKNYEIVRDQFVNLESPDVRQSRVSAKPILLENGGIVHRGGQVVIGEADETQCPDLGAYPDDGKAMDGTLYSPFCALREWHDQERKAAIAAGNLDDLGGQTTALNLVYVTRPADQDHPLEFDHYRPGADLLVASVPVDATGAIGAAGGAGTSLLASCAGVTAGQSDVRRPRVSHDGQKVVFALRKSQDDNLNVYEVGIDGTGCRALTSDTGEAQSGARAHNFDPVYLPGDDRVAFASSKGGDAGPTRTLRRFEPNSDIWLMKTDGSEMKRLTYTLNSDRFPELMQNGQLIFTTEKATRDFYQLASRRINVDGSDFHPLFGQRRKNNKGTTSIGFGEVTEPQELPNRNFVGIFADPDGTGTRTGAGGQLGIFNRSIGPFEKDRASEVSFLSSLTMVPGAGGGVYRSPSGLPDGRILASYSSAGDGSAYAVVAVDPTTGGRTAIVAGGDGQVAVDAILAIRRVRPDPFQQGPQLIFGGDVDPSRGNVAYAHFLDLPLLGSLMEDNDRDGRVINDKVVGLRVLEERAPPPGTHAASDVSDKLKGDFKVYEDLYEVGKLTLESDGSAKVKLPAGLPVRWQLLDGNGAVLFTLREEFMLGAGERVNLAVPRKLFNGTCGGCHSAKDGSDLETAIIPDALTSASISASSTKDPADLTGGNRSPVTLD
jgi:hypothetical protein